MPTCRRRRGSHPGFAAHHRPHREPARAPDAGGGPAGPRRRHGRHPGGGGRLPPLWSRMAHGADRSPRPDAAPGDGRDRGLPYCGARRPPAPLRRLRSCRDRLRLVPQPALPQVPGRGTGSLGRGPPRRTVAGALLPRRLHPAAVGAIAFQSEPRCATGSSTVANGRRLRHPVPRRRRDVAHYRRRPAPPRCGGVAVLHSWGQAMHDSRPRPTIQHVRPVAPGVQAASWLQRLVLVGDGVALQLSRSPRPFARRCARAAWSRATSRWPVRRRPCARPPRLAMPAWTTQAPSRPTPRGTMPCGSRSGSASARSRSATPRISARPAPTRSGRPSAA
jgi:hypothetical protein